MTKEEKYERNFKKRFSIACTIKSKKESPYPSYNALICETEVDESLDIMESGPHDVISISPLARISGIRVDATEKNRFRIFGHGKGKINGKYSSLDVE